MELLKKICRICLSWMREHQTMPEWLKCICGYSKLENPLITSEEYYMGRDVTYKNELTPELEQNSVILLEKVNALLNHLKIKENFWDDLPSGGKKLKVSSGWRPGAVNREVGGAKNSAHIQCMAIDIYDTWSQDLAGKMTPEVLEMFDLYMENPKHTKGKWTAWVHLQTRPAKTGRIFNP